MSTWMVLAVSVLAGYHTDFAAGQGDVAKDITVEVGNSVHLEYSCHVFSLCPNGVELKIGEDVYSWAVVNQSLPQYSAIEDHNFETYVSGYTLLLKAARISDNGSTYQWRPVRDSDAELSWSNTQRLVVKPNEASDHNETQSASNEDSQLHPTATPTAISATLQSPTQSLPSPPSPAATTSTAAGSEKLAHTTVSTSNTADTTTSYQAVTTSTPDVNTMTPISTAATTNHPITTPADNNNNNNNNNEKPLSDTVAQNTENDAPTYVYVAVGSGVGIVVYVLTIVLIGLVISLKIKAKRANRRSRRGSPANPYGDSYLNTVPMVPMVSNPVYSEVMTPMSPAPPYFKEDPSLFEGRQVVVNLDSRYHDVPQRKSAAVESLYDYIDMQ